MALIPVITRAKFDTLEDTLKVFYKPVGDTFQLDIEEASLSEHMAVKNKDKPLLDELDDLRSKNNDFQHRLEQNQELLNGYKKQTNNRVINDTVLQLTENLDLSDGRKELLDRLLEPKINSILSKLEQDDTELDRKLLSRELNNELNALKKISASTFIEKKDVGGGVRYEKQKGTITTNQTHTEEAENRIDYDNYRGSISSIDYEDYMNNYFYKED